MNTMKNNKGNGPYFIGIGARKTASTWIYHCLYEHPEIYASIKEIHFFNNNDNYQKGLFWYESFFNKCPINKKTGEITSSYLTSPNAADRIYKLYPDVKIIICLRDPIERAFSHYLHDLRCGHLKKNIPFQKALLQNPQYIENGLYYKYLKNYFALFPKKNILIMLYEDINKNPIKYIQTIYKFIGIDYNFIPSVINKRFNEDLFPRFQ